MRQVCLELEGSAASDINFQPPLTIISGLSILDGNHLQALVDKGSSGLLGADCYLYSWTPARWLSRNMNPTTLSDCYLFANLTSADLASSVDILKLAFAWRSF
jgi:hypothetical protein